MKLQNMTTKELLAMHNTIADEPAGPKTFATKTKLIARIESIAKAKMLDIRSPGRATQAEVPEQPTQPQVTLTETAAAQPGAEAKASGKGVGRLARQILLDPAGYPHALIAEMVNVQIEGTKASAKSVRWYAHDMRKNGMDVPKRQKVHAAYMNEQESEEWLKSVIAVSTSSIC